MQNIELIKALTWAKQNIDKCLDHENIDPEFQFTKRNLDMLVRDHERIVSLLKGE